MPQFKFATDRTYSACSFESEQQGWERAGLYNDHPRKEGSSHTTAVRRLGSGTLHMPPLSPEWEVFVLSGDLLVEGTAMAEGDHCLIAANEAVKISTSNGCQYLVIAH